MKKSFREFFRQKVRGWPPRYLLKFNFSEVQVLINFIRLV